MIFFEICEKIEKRYSEGPLFFLKFLQKTIRGTLVIFEKVVNLKFRKSRSQHPIRSFYLRNPTFEQVCGSQNFNSAELRKTFGQRIFGEVIKGQ